MCVCYHMDKIGERAKPSPGCVMEKNVLSFGFAQHLISLVMFCVKTHSDMLRWKI